MPLSEPTGYSFISVTDGNPVGSNLVKIRSLFRSEIQIATISISAERNKDLILIRLRGIRRRKKEVGRNPVGSDDERKFRR